MSDSVKNPDIEDVLSSIRRLVSHDGGRKAINKNDAQDSQDQSSKLVLTPALRVEGGEAADVSTPPSDDDMSDTEALELISPDVPLAFTSARAAKQKAEDEEQMLSAEDPVDHVSEPTEEHADIAELPSVDTAQSTSAADDADAQTVAPEEATSAFAPHTPTAHETLTAKIAALEEVIGREPDQWEPESEGLGENAGTDVDALPWEDHIDGAGAQSEDGDPRVEDEVSAVQSIPEEPVREAVDDSPADPELSDMEDTILDEAMLRDLVSNIVREELQGALGERITRNVRKLVRREIHRALSAQDFN